MKDDMRKEYAQVALGEVREELARTDSKVATLLASAGVAGSIIGGSILAGNWRPSVLAVWGQALWWLGVTSALAGAALLASALMPRAGHMMPKSSLRYFGHYVQFASPGELLGALSVSARDVGDDFLLERAVDQLWVISSLVSLKYSRIRQGLRLLAVAAACVIAVLTIPGMQR